MAGLGRTAATLAFDDSKAVATKNILNKDRRDISHIWNDALVSYKGIVGRDLQRQYKDVDSMFAASIGEKDKFLKWRHDGGKLDRLRTLFKDNMSIIEIGTQKLVSAAEPAFPPAAAIGTALTFILAACKSVSADYDVITVFFEDMKGFLQRVKILERRLPELTAYHNCLMDVFTSLLRMCAFATVSMERGRFKKWVTSMFVGEDPELATARQDLDNSLNALKDASQFAILGNTEDMKVMQRELQKSLEDEKAVSVRNSYVLAKLRTDQAELLDGVKQLLAFIQEEKTRGQTTITKASLKYSSNSRIRSAFSEIPGNAIQMQIIRETHITGTCAWLWDEPAWKSWVKPDSSSNPWLLLVGPPGIGKSHLAVAVYDRLWEIADQDPGGHTCTAYAFCRDSVDSMQSVDAIIVSIMLQIADQNVALREQLNLALTKDGDRISGDKWDDVFQQLIMPIFVKTSKYRLNLVIDAVNELTPVDRVRLGTLLETIQKQGLRIRALITNRPVVEAEIRTLQKKRVILEQIPVTKQKVLSDLKKIIQLRLQSGDSAHQGLLRLSKNLKTSIGDTIEDIADGILYTEHILRHLSMVGRPGAIAKELKAMPVDMNALFMKLMDFSQRRTPVDLRQTVKVLLAWMAFSFDPLTLDDANFIVQSTSDNTSLLVEEDIQEFVGRFIRFGGALYENEDSGTAVSTVNDIRVFQFASRTAYDDGQLEVVFRERSMLEFFRKADRNENSLRTYESVAHKEIFLSCCQILTNSHVLRNRGRLLEYATKYCLRHWMCIGGTNQAELAYLSDSDKIVVCSAFKNLLSNRSSLASALETIGKELNLESLFVFHKFVNLDYFYSVFIKNWNAWSETITTSSCRSELDASTLEFWNNGHDHAFVPLAKGHIENWLAASDPDPASARAAYNHARRTLKKTHLRHLLYADFPNHPQLDIAAGEQAGRLRGQGYNDEIFRLRDNFRSGLDSNAHYATAVLLNAFDAIKPAMDEMVKAIEACNDDREQSRNHVYLGRIQLRMLEDPANEGRFAEISSSMILNVSKALKLRSKMASSLVVRALQVKAEAESRSGQAIAALSTCNEIRAVDNILFVPTEVMTQEFKIHLSRCDYKGTMNLFINWKPIERLTWIIDQKDFPDRILHRHLLCAAIHTGQIKDLIEMYSEVIANLDAVGCGAIWREHLASTLWRFMDDPSGAEEVLNEVLDGSCKSQEYAIGNIDAGIVAIRAMNMMCDILYQQFRRSNNAKLKLELLEKVNTLPQRQLVQSVQISITNTVPQLLVLANMIRKVGRPDQFEETLRQAFNICWDNLHDNLVWNDSTNVRYLARIIDMFISADELTSVLVASQLYSLDMCDDLSSKAQFKINASDNEALHNDAAGPTNSTAANQDQLQQAITSDSNAPDTSSIVASEKSASDEESVEEIQLQPMPIYQKLSEAYQKVSQTPAEEAILDETYTETEDGSVSLESVHEETTTAEIISPAAGYERLPEESPATSKDPSEHGSVINEELAEEVTLGRHYAPPRFPDNASATNVEPTEPSYAIDEILAEEVIHRHIYAVKAGWQMDEDWTERYQAQETFSFYHWTSEKEQWKTNLKDTMFPRCQGTDCDKEWELWCTPTGQETMYVCRYCTESILCQKCYDRKCEWSESGRPSDVADYCCDGLEYITGPDDTWRGIRNGRVYQKSYYQDGEEVCEFSALLQSVKDGWEKGWDMFWMG